MSSDKQALHYLAIGEASELLRAKQLSPVELTRAYLERIEALDGTLQTYITLLPEQALDQARRAEAEIQAGNYRGPLHGIPIALKDLYDTAGVRTTSASRSLADRVPEQDATATARLRDAGTILLGKLTMHELALGGPDPTSGFPMARNPWNLDHVPGGSSSGSAAAVAAGLCMASLGSCTGGSIRGPASHCSIVGLKPTYGRVSRSGVLPLSWTLDHCGPMTWTVEDSALMLQAIAGHDPKDPTSSRAPVPDYRAALRADISGLRIGVPRHFFFADSELISKETLAVAEEGLKTLESLGVRLEEVKLPTLEIFRPAHMLLMLSEGYAFSAPKLRERPQDFGVMARHRFRAAGLLTSGDYIQAQRVRARVEADFARVLQDVDLLVTPTMSSPAERFDEVNILTSSRVPSFTAPFNMTGLPAISVPAGFTPGGLPVGLQLAGRPFDESTVLRAAYTAERHLRLYERRPPL